MQNFPSERILSEISSTKIESSLSLTIKARSPLNSIPLIETSFSSVFHLSFLGRVLLEFQIEILAENSPWSKFEHNQGLAYDH